MMEGKAFRGAALAALPALCLALCLAAPSPALAAQTATTDVTIVAAGFWPAQETSTVDVRTPSPAPQQSALFSQTSDASRLALMVALACMATSSLALIACLTRRES